MTAEYESTNVPGLYFAGTLSHGKDFKRASGGFIHGFRYTARALHRILAKKYFGAEWPTREFCGSQAPTAHSSKERRRPLFWQPFSTVTDRVSGSWCRFPESWGQDGENGENMGNNCMGKNGREMA